MPGFPTAPRPEPPEPDVPDRREAEEKRIYAWRRDEFLRLGYRLPDAEQLAVKRVDPHDVERLLGKGCPLETAARILL